MPFQIRVYSYNIFIASIVIDEGMSVGIFSSTAWQGLGSKQLVPITHNLLTFNKGTIEPLWILPYFPVTLGGNNVYINAMVSKSIWILIYSLGMIMFMTWKLLPLQSFM